MRLVNLEGSKFWEGWLEGAEVCVSSGAVGGKARSSRKAFPDERQADSDLQSKYRARLREGYLFRSSDLPAEGWGLSLALLVSRVHTGFYSLDYSPAEELFAVGRPSADETQKECELLLIDARTGLVRRTLTLTGFDLNQVRFAPDSEVLYARMDGRVFRIERESGERKELCRTDPLSLVTLQLSRDGSRMLAGDHLRMVVMELSTGSVLLEVPVKRIDGHRESLSAALSPSGNLAALSREPGKIELYDLRSGTSRTLAGDFPYTRRLVFHPSDRYLALAEHYENWAMWVLDLESGAELDRFRSRLEDGTLGSRPSCVSESLAFTADGTLLARGDQGWIHLHDFETGEVVAGHQPEFLVRSNSFDFTFAGTSDTLLARVDLGVVSVFRRAAVTLPATGAPA